MDLDRQRRGLSETVELTGIDRRLHRDMGRRLELKVPTPRLGHQVSPERTLDVDGAGVPPCPSIRFE
jgi:hypothetical protein